MNNSIGKFYKGKKVFVTGHNGFKGSWMCKVLKMMGAEVCGFSLSPNTSPNLYELANIQEGIKNINGDIRNGELLKQSVKEFAPDIIIHMAAQPIVRESYKDPVYTYETNVMGTVHILEAVRECSTVKSFLNVTTSAGPGLVGMISELSGRGLKAGLFSAIVFPVILVAGIWMIKQENRR